MKNRGLVVVGVALANPGQRPFVILRSGRVIDGLPVFVEHREGICVVALTLGLRLNGQGPAESCCALLQLIGGRWRPYRVIPCPRNAPVGVAQVGSAFEASLNAMRASS